MTQRALIIGYGNPYRRDDGVAYHIINALRARLGKPALTPVDDGEDDLGGVVDTLMLHQLLPELAPLLAGYPLVIFVDAHVGIIPEEVRVLAVEEEYGFQATTHHMSPGMMLRITRETTGAAPVGFLVSVKGEDFDFGTELSAACQANAAAAVEKIMEMIEAENPESRIQNSE
jgi:hydrogenase maturation protease